MLQNNFKNVEESTKTKNSKPTTPNPITAPPEKAISRAFPRLFLAAFAVRTFALVATFMPKKPARAEQMAPTMNDTATKPLLAGLLDPLQKRSAATAITKIRRTRYSALRNAMKPSSILFAILDILSEPADA